MRKLSVSLLLICVFLLMAKVSLAQSPRQPTSSEGKTTFTNIAIVGLNNDGTNDITAHGTPAYIEMTSAKGDIFYLYIDYNGILRIASEVAVGYGASPATVSWASAASGVPVATQVPDDTYRP